MARSGSGIDMGLGLLGNDNIVFKRKYRWTMEFFCPCDSVIGSHLVKVASRPNISIEETEIKAEVKVETKPETKVEKKLNFKYLK